MSEWKTIETVKVPLTGGLFATIDAADLPLVSRFSWHARPRRDRRGYYAVNSAGTRMHRLLVGAWGREIVDHRDGDGLNNTRRNIRKGTQSQNCVNRQRTPGPHLRGARPKKGLWQAYIKYQGKQKSLGYFATEDDAHAAYLAAAVELHGDWMPLPDPPTT
jgi:hypothetical protein